MTVLKIMFQDGLFLIRWSLQTVHVMFTTAEIACTVHSCQSERKQDRNLSSRHEVCGGSPAGSRGAASLPDDQPPTRLLPDRGSTTYPMFDMLECGPTWDYTAGGAILLLVAAGLNTKLVKQTCGRVQVMFDKTQVWLCMY